ncbi:hypothetical protein [Pseudomonas fluorescens]|uniref:hypothetical protein n=1 Tax=Pseudomonas fluorescens TaxID=294 RepID=UPI00123F13A3|nr:hypothetical protein [Pseudomonas fluorescens]
MTDLLTAANIVLAVATALLCWACYSLYRERQALIKMGVQYDALRDEEKRLHTVIAKIMAVVEGDGYEIRRRLRENHLIASSLAAHGDTFLSKNREVPHWLDGTDRFLYMLFLACEPLLNSDLTAGVHNDRSIEKNYRCFSNLIRKTKALPYSNSDHKRK